MIEVHLAPFLEKRTDVFMSGWETRGDLDLVQTAPYLPMERVRLSARGKVIEIVLLQVMCALHHRVRLRTLVPRNEDTKGLK